MSPFVRKHPFAPLVPYSGRMLAETRATLEREASRRGVRWTELVREACERAAREIETRENAK